MRIYLSLLLTLVLCACGSHSHRFTIEGRFLHINQGELYIYSLDDAIDGIDTIKIDAGRIAYEMTCERPSTLVLVFPNFSEQPVFAKPGTSVDIKADASHLKELKVIGTEENKLMNKFREEIAEASPPETVKFAAMFIKDHPKSVVSVYLLRKYFLLSRKPDYKQALELVELLKKNQPDNGHLVAMKKQIMSLQQTSVGSRLPSFNGYDINGGRVSQATLNGPLAVVSVWATWNYDSQNMQRRLNAFQKAHPGKLKVLSICVDPSRKLCRRTLRLDSVAWPTVCDQEMLASPLLERLGLFCVPDNLVISNGRVVARGLSTADLETKLNQLVR